MPPWLICIEMIILLLIAESVSNEVRIHLLWYTVSKSSRYIGFFLVLIFTFWACPWQVTILVIEFSWRKSPVDAFTTSSVNCWSWSYGPVSAGTIFIQLYILFTSNVWYNVYVLSALNSIILYANCFGWTCFPNLCL